MSDDISELIAPERQVRRNWFTALPVETRRDLVRIRAAYNAASERANLGQLLERIKARHPGVHTLPANTRRLSEFIRNECGMYPDTEADDGQAAGRLGGNGGTGAEGRA